jgi:hypothetical protein
MRTLRAQSFHSLFALNRRNGFLVAPNAEAVILDESVRTFLTELQRYLDTMEPKAIDWKLVEAEGGKAAFDSLPQRLKIGPGIWERLFEVARAAPGDATMRTKQVACLAHLAPFLSAKLSEGQLEELTEWLVQVIADSETLFQPLLILAEVLKDSDWATTKALNLAHLRPILARLEAQTPIGANDSFIKPLRLLHWIVDWTTEVSCFPARSCPEFFGDLGRLTTQLISRDLEILESGRLLALLLSKGLFPSFIEVAGQPFANFCLKRYLLTPISDDFALIGLKFLAGITKISTFDFPEFLVTTGPQIIAQIRKFLEAPNKQLVRETLDAITAVAKTDLGVTFEFFEKTGLGNDVLFLLCHAKAPEIIHKCFTFLTVYGIYSPAPSFFFDQHVARIIEVSLKKVLDDQPCDSKTEEMVLELLEVVFIREEDGELEDGERGDLAAVFATNGFTIRLSHWQLMVSEAFADKIDQLLFKYLE